MSDWAQDPIFGDVALRWSPRAFVAPSHRARGAAADDARALVFVRADRMSESERALLGDELDPRFGVLDVRVARLRALLAQHSAIACLVESVERAAAPVAAPRILGVVNATPDSFSDGGEHHDPERAIEHGLRLVADGADMLDVGGESTRPGSEPVEEREELRRVLPVVRGLAERTRIPISVDTTKSAVARECLAAGATLVNDVSAGRFDPAILAVTARAGAGYVAMHMLGTPRDMQVEPRYADVVGEVLEFLRARCRAALDAGIERSKLWIDPGIGFGKTLEHNLELLRRLAALRSLGLPVLLGVSRKSFIATIEERAELPRSAAAERLGGSLAALVLGLQNGAEILRVHDVRESKQAALVARAVLAHRD